jgi:hypothetical protein
MTESLPSGVLKVAEECARLAEEFAEVYILARNVNAPICIAARSGLHAAIDRLAALASPPPQATGAQPHPEPSEEASSLPSYIYGREAGPNEKVWTEASMNAMRAERDKWYQEAAAQAASAIAAHEELEALKAAPVVREPLTEERIHNLLDTHVGSPTPRYPLTADDFTDFARAVEYAHGISQQAAQKEGE